MKPHGTRLALILGALLLAVAARGTTLFGLIDTGELYASTDGGAAWQIRSTLPVSDAVGLAAAATSSQLYAASASGSVYRSSDGGVTWVGVGAVTAGDVAAFAVDPFGALLLLTRTGTLYRSTDQGATFTPLAALTGSAWRSLARGPLGRLYALAATGEVAQSTDQGTTWTAVGALPVSNAVSLGRMGSALFVLTQTGETYRSLDYGVSWVAVSALASSGMRALLDLNGSELIAASETGEVARTPNGTAWSWVGAVNQLNLLALGSDTPQATGVPVDASAPRYAGATAAPNPRVGPGGAVFGFDLPAPERVRLELYDAAGRLRAVRNESWIGAAGRQAVRWEPPGIPTGAYFVRVVFASGRTLDTRWTVVR